MHKQVLLYKTYLKFKYKSFFIKSGKSLLFSTKQFFCPIKLISVVKSINENTFFLIQRNKWTNFFCKTNILNNFFSIINNFVKGLNQDFFVKFRVVGLGFRLQRIFVNKFVRVLRLSLGYSHGIFYKIPQDIGVFIKKKVFFLYSHDLNSLMVVAKKLMSLREVNPYKEKGIYIFDKKVRLKSGKQQQK